VLASCAAPIACASDPEPKPKALSARLEEDTGVAWAVYADDQAKAVRFLAPEKPVKTSEASPEAAARAFFDRYRDALFGSDGADELRLVPKNEGTPSDADGAYVRFEHFLKGTDVRVFDVASTARFTTDGALMWLQSGFRANLGSAPRAAAVAAHEAANKAIVKSTELCGAPVRQDEDGEPTSTLGVITDAGAARLVWRVQILRSTERCAVPTVTIDATTGDFVTLTDGAQSLWDDAAGVRGEALGDKSNIRRIDVTSRLVSVTGKYLMLTESLPAVSTSTYGTLFNSAITTDALGSWDASSPARGAAVDAHYNVMHALRYFREIHGRRSTTGWGNPISVIVHHPFANGTGGVDGNNAANNSRAWVINEMLCGDGDYLQGGNLLPLCSALDVTAHEIAHGVTSYTSGLLYKGESGALNESFADVMGASAENALEANDEGRNFLIGERITKNGKGLRDMVTPQRDNQGEDSYDNFRKCSGGPTLANDQCNVHSNSGIPNRAFSLMTAGGFHRRSFAYANAIGWKAARDLWFGTFTKLAPDADFKTAALAQVTEALNRGPDMFRSVACAWYGVGVLTRELHPAITTLACPFPAPPGSPQLPKGPDCQGRNSGWFCSDNVKNTAIKCKGGAVESGAFCADPEQQCKKAAVDDWTATVSASGEVVYQ